MVRNAHHILSDERGVAATEFAFLLPILLLLVMGIYESTRFVLFSQKLDRVAYTVADVTAQQTAVTNADLSDIVTAATKIMEPYEFGELGRVIISSVYQDPDDGPVVRWQYAGGGTLPRDSLIGDPGEPATLPDGFTLNDEDNVIVAEVFYYYTPPFSEDYLSTRENYKTAVFKPRFGALTTAPN
ncbi:MAG: pilus assembly protein [Rhodospirillales bacterium]|nr:pilus assembly protein [Alphaproteobacteria bacterium]MCB9986178.1 pilus assembly protein [Rhodospirillales bacterium]USO07265.1 MAG: pilus assembly protein [Rhodospirillales bacterium]